MHISVVTKDFLRESIQQMLTEVRTERFVSALLAGFSIASVISLLFIDHTNLTLMMFFASISSSWLFLLALLLYMMKNEACSCVNKYLEQMSIEESYERVRMIRNSNADGWFWLGVFCLLPILICAGFVESIIAGIYSSVVAIMIIVILFRNIANNITLVESHYFDWNQTYVETLENDTSANLPAHDDS